MLQVHRSEGADQLVEALGRLLAEPLPDPVQAEVVAVPTRGVERWISQRLAHRLGVAGTGGGVCANVDFPFPGRLLAAATATAAAGGGAAEDPWRPDRAVWPLIEVIDAHLEDGRLAPLAAHLRASAPPDRREKPRRYDTARHLAELFDRYSVHRPDLVLAWAAGRTGEDELEAWQAYLWRLLRARIGCPAPAERVEAASAAIAARPGAVDLPPRLSVFGITRLPDSHLQVLEALAFHRDVHLFLLHPSPGLWDQVASRPPPPRLRRHDDPTARLGSHPLLRTWGRDAREMQLVLASRQARASLHHPVPGRPDSLLHRLQEGIRLDRQPAPDGPGSLAGDGSVAVHSCHGRTRQVEVLRDALLHLLEDDPSLELRDVIVMCPDIDAFAPHIRAVFERSPADGPDVPHLRARLADRAVLQTNPLLSVASDLLALAASRVPGSAVMDLAARPVVARRFQFDVEELAQIEKWVVGTGVRWGLDAHHRRRWKLEDFAANTWAFGLDRLLLGVAMAAGDGTVLGGVAPYDDMPSVSVDLAGRFAEFVTRVRWAVQHLAGPMTVGAWSEVLQQATENLALASSGDSWQHDEFRRALDEAASEAAAGSGPAGGPQLALEEVRAFLAGRLAGRPTRANFRTGDLTFCTLVPMRSVPHRVVAVMGLDDGAFPRHTEIDGDDLLLADPRVGDRDARSEDRQLLLDAVMAAGDRLIITYSGHDERTNIRRPPCAPLAELLDVLDAMCPGGARSSVVVRHPLQAFDSRNFTPGALLPGRSWGFDRIQLGGAVAMAAQRPPSPWLSQMLPAVEDPVIPLDLLVSFVQAPVRTFLRRRLSLYLSDPEEPFPDALPLELDPLEEWGVGDRLLSSVLAGVSLDRAVEGELARGFLPPGPLAEPVTVKVRPAVERLARAVGELGLPDGPAAAIDVRVQVPGGPALAGSVTGLRGATVMQCVYSRLAAKHRLAAWVRFLAVTAAAPEAGYRAVSVGRGQAKRFQLCTSVLQAPGTDPTASSAWAHRRLAELVDLYQRGMREPLPLACDTSWAWTKARRAGDDEAGCRRAAGEKWDSSAGFGGEAAQPDHVEVFGPNPPFSRLLEARPRADETGPGWPDGPSRFEVLARRLWDPLADVEELTES